MEIRELFIILIERLSIIVTLAFLYSRTRVFQYLIRQNSTHREKIALILIFGAVGIMGTYLGIPIYGALANTRVIGPAVGGLFGGPVVGIGAGLLAGVQRFYIGGFTAFACGISTSVEGLIAGFVGKGIRHEVTPKVAFWTGFFAETLQMIIILLLARPFEEALALVKVIGLPMIVVNSTGMAIFVLVINTVLREREKKGAEEAQRALKIADKTLPYLRQGLNKYSAGKVASIILESTDVQAVSITDGQEILAHVGIGEDHHKVGEKVVTSLTGKVLKSGDFAIANNPAEIGCFKKDCPLKSAVVIPLKRRNKVIGVLKLYHTSEKAISDLDKEFAEGLAHLFSTQLEIAELEKQSKLLADAEIRALQAQINPHFLFNAINTIISFIRFDPEKARKLLIQLGDFFRQNLEAGTGIVSLQKELKHIDAYLSIEKARFEDKLTVEKDIPENLLDVKLPALTLQPLVENAVRHGLLPLKAGGRVSISARKEGKDTVIIVEDTGIGISKEQIRCVKEDEKFECSKGTTGIGLKNVNERLKSIYGSEYELQFEILEPHGTRVTVKIPRKGDVKDAIEGSGSR